MSIGSRDWMYRCPEVWETGCITLKTGLGGAGYELCGAECKAACTAQAHAVREGQ